MTAMTGLGQPSFGEQKGELRRQIKRLRQNQADKDGASSRILSIVTALPAYTAAKTVLWYLDVRDEVRTRDWLLGQGLQQAKEAGQKVVVPWCEGQTLGLFALQAAGELQVGKFGILEPKETLRTDPAFQVAPQAIDLAIIPGVAFDKQGGRLGHGAGYYDRLLADLRSDCSKLGIGYACQVVEAVPCDSHDVRMDAIVTEAGIVFCKEQV